MMPLSTRSLAILPLLLACMTACGGSSSSSGRQGTYPSAYTSHTRSSHSSRHRSRSYRRTHTRSSRTSRSSRAAAAQPPSVLLAARSKRSGCQPHGSLPDSACTPGATFKGVTSAQVCRLGYSSRVRLVSSSTKSSVYREYGIRSHRPGQYEVDHLVSLELGGSNSIANLWPEAAGTVPGFHEKDQVENYLHNQVCDGHLTLQQAQRQIAGNWVSVYHSMGH